MISNPFPCSICLKANRRCILYSARASLGVRHGLQQLVLLPAVCLGCAVQMQSPYDYRELETLYRYEDGKYQIERGSDILRAWTMAESKSCVCPALEDTAHQDRGVDYTVEELQHQEQDSNQIDNDLTNPDLTETSHPVDETDAQVTRADTDEIDTAMYDLFVLMRLRTTSRYCADIGDPTRTTDTMFVFRLQLHDSYPMAFNLSNLGSQASTPPSTATLRVRHSTRPGVSSQSD